MSAKVIKTTLLQYRHCCLLLGLLAFSKAFKTRKNKNQKKNPKHQTKKKKPTTKQKHQNITVLVEIVVITSSQQNISINRTLYFIITPEFFHASLFFVTTSDPFFYL
jgi:hypothetical protein